MAINFKKQIDILPTNLTHLTFGEFFNQKVKLPACKELLCEWLYGKSWRTPRLKNVSYIIRIIENRPMLIKPIPRIFERFIPKPIRPLIERLIS